MSYQTWHNYGYGICVSDIGEPSKERLRQLIHCAPKCEDSIDGWLLERKIMQPTYEDYMDYDQDYSLGLATILYEVIEEAEGIAFTMCDDFDCRTYLIYPPSYPWLLSQKEAGLTEEKIAEILGKYVRILTDKKVTIEYQSVENGG